MKAIFDRGKAVFLSRSFLLICLVSFMMLPPDARAFRFGDAKPETWVCYYGSRLGVKHYGRFDVAVLDGLNPPPLEKRDGKKPLLIGYVSVGEVHGSGVYWELAKNKPFLARENKEWNSWVADLRDQEWQTILMDRIVGAVAGRGFDGFFLDTIDSILHLTEGKEGKNYAGMEQAVVAFIKKLRSRYPDRIIAVNRGLRILPDIAADIDIIVVEDLYSYYDSGTKKYLRVNKETRDILLGQIERGMKANPRLVVFTIDYASPGQRSLAMEAIKFSRERGFVPYVGNYKLDKIYMHTLKR